MITVDGGDGHCVPLIDLRRSRSSAALKWRKGTLALAAAQKFGALVGGPCEPPPIRRLRAGAFVVRAAYGFKRAGQNIEHLTLRVTETEPVSVDKLQELMRRKSLPLLQKLGGLPGLEAALQTDLVTGLPNEQQVLEQRHSWHRSDFNPSKPLKLFRRYTWEATRHPTLLVFMLYALLSILFGTMSPGAHQYVYEGGSIAITLLLVIAVPAISDYGQSFRFQVLAKKKEEDIQVAVIRGSCQRLVSIFDLVVGDVVLLNMGEIVPGNGLLIVGHSLTVNEEPLTGESDAVHVDIYNPFLRFGCKVTSGNGTMLVTEVGTNIEWGNIMSTVSEDALSRETPLQARLCDLAAFFGKVGAMVAFAGLLALLVFYFIDHSSVPFQTAPFKRGVTSAKQIVLTVVKILFMAMTIAIVAVPDGLPLAIILTLANSMKKMTADQALVRRLSTCETMGSITAICVDITGALAHRKMTVLKCWMGGRMYTESECTNAPIRLREGIAVVYSSGSVEGGPPEETRSLMENAIVNWGLKLGMDYKHFHQALCIVQKEPFGSEKKCVGVAIRSLDCAMIRVHWTGPAEIILGLCSKVCTIHGQGEVACCMPAKMRDEIRETIKKMTDDGLFCVAFAYRPLQQGEEVPGETDNCQLPKDGLSLLAIVGMRDSCWPGVSDAIGAYRKADIVVRMVTRDNLALAVAVAKEYGILTSDESLEPSRHAIEGARFRNWSEEERNNALADIKVMACSSPRDKFLMVRALRERGDIVAVVGDRTSDALALQEADVGLAMGIEGTEVAKDSSDIVILDDNFETVVRVIRWGRSIYANIQKFFQLQLPVNVTLLVVTLVAIASKRNMPLSSVQLLWVNFILSFLGAWALATEQPTQELMSNPPVGCREPLVTNSMWRNIFGQASYQIVVLLTLQFRGKQILNIQDDILLNTIIFNCFVFCQIFNEVNARRPTRRNIFEGLHKSHLFLGIIGFTLVLQVIIVEFLWKLASVTSLKWDHWLICVAIGSLSWPIAFVVKFIPVPKRHFLQTNGQLRRWRRQTSQNACLNQSSSNTKTY